MRARSVTRTASVPSALELVAGDPRIRAIRRLIAQADAAIAAGDLVRAHELLAQAVSV